MKKWDKVVLPDGSIGIFYAETEDGLALVFVDGGAKIIDVNKIKPEEVCAP